jgi:predicted peptidase
MCLHGCSLRTVLLLCIISCSFIMCRKKVEAPSFPGVREEYHSFVPVQEAVNEVFGGYYVALPPRYEARIDSFPLLLFLHGLGQMGNGSSDLHYITFDGIGRLIAKGKFPVSFASGGRLFSFIVVSPQSSQIPTEADVKELLDHVTSTYRVDRSRVYLSGLSMGARVVTLAAAAYAEEFAAIVPIAGVAVGPGMQNRCKAMAEAELPVWELHNLDDPMAPIAQAQQFISALAGFNPRVKPRFTVFDVYGHDAWTTALDPVFQENGMNIYEWMLQYSR